MEDEERAETFPSIGEIRASLTCRGERLGTGWPVVDDVSGGLPAVGTTVVRGPSELRLQVLARTAVWAAGEGYPVLLGSRSRTTDELRLAVAAGGLGLPPRALLDTTAHDDWLDDRLRVLDLRVHGGPDAHERAGRDVHQRPPALLVVDDYLTWERDWDAALDIFEGRLDLQLFPRRMGISVVLGVTSMDYFSDWLDRTALTVRLDPSGDASRVTVYAYEGLHRGQRTVPLRDGFLPPPHPGRIRLSRPRVTNVWTERSEAEIEAFADTLGARTTETMWVRDDQDLC